MYTDDVSDKESEHEDKTLEESHNILKKSLSTFGFRKNPENQKARQLGLHSTQSFTSVVDELRFCDNLQRLNLNSGNAVSSPAVCPCRCFLRPAVAVPFRTRERNTLALNGVPPEVLHHHGYDFNSSQIATFWKKDCRKFLWKGGKKRSLQIEARNHQCHPNNI